MNKHRKRPLNGKQAMSANLRKIARQNQLYGFRMALDGIAATWGALIQNLSKKFFTMPTPKNGSAALTYRRRCGKLLIGCHSLNYQRRSDTWQHPKSVVVADRR